MATTDNPITAGNYGTTEQQQSSGLGRVKETAANLGRSAAHQIDKNMESAAGALERSADAIRSRVSASGSRVAGIADTAAEKLESTARYFREHHTQDVMTDVERYVRRNPGASVAGAFGVGFLIGMMIRRD